MRLLGVVTACCKTTVEMCACHASGLRAALCNASPSKVHIQPCPSILLRCAAATALFRQPVHFSLQGLFSGPDTLANLKHQVIISTPQGNSISAPCDEAAAASFAAASSSRGVGLQLKQQQQLLSQPPSVVWQHIKSSSGSGRVLAAVVLVGFAACAVVWLAAAKGRPKVKDAYHVRSV
jgi:hypothetical protein